LAERLKDNSVMRRRDQIASDIGGVAFGLALILYLEAFIGDSIAKPRYLSRSEILEIGPCHYKGMNLRDEKAFKGYIKNDGSISAGKRHGRWWATKSNMFCRQFKFSSEKGSLEYCSYVVRHGSTYTFHNTAGRAFLRITCR
jgi:hypothetical protein